MKASYDPREHGYDLDEFFGFDRILRLPREIAGYTVSPFAPRFRHKVLEQERHWRIVRDGDGITKKVFRIDQDASMPQFLDFPVRDWATWERVKPRLELNEKLRFRKWDSLRAEYDRADGQWPVMARSCGAFGLARNLMGDEQLFYAFYDEPELVHDIERQWLYLNKAIFTRMVEDIDVDVMLIWEDMAYKNGPLFSPTFFRAFILPYYRELTAYLKEIGIKNIWVDSDGNLQELIPLLVECGVTGIFPFEVQAGNDVRRIASDYPGKFTIVGGIDKRALSKSPEAIKLEVDRVMKYFGCRKGYMPTLDHSVPPDVSFENFKYYLKCLRLHLG